MTNSLDNLNPRPDDLVVVPEHMEVAADAPFHVFKMKFLHQPSIIRSGGYSMGLLDVLAKTRFGAWLGDHQSLRDTVFDKGSYGTKIRGDSSYGEGSFVHHAELAPPEVLNKPRIVAGVMGNVRSHGGLPEISIGQPEVVDTETWRARMNADLTQIFNTGSKVETFFRHVRNKQLKSTPRMGASGLPEWDLEVSPKGGVTFYIELDAPNKSFAFSYALCNNTDNFDYSKGRNIARGRFKAEQWYEVKNYDSDKSIVDNIGVALYNFMYNSDVNEKDTVFSSTPEGEHVSYTELKEIYKRI